MTGISEETTTCPLGKRRLIDVTSESLRCAALAPHLSDWYISVIAFRAPHPSSRSSNYSALP